MSVDASLPLQKAVVAALKADATINALVAGRVYDQPPTNAVRPYISLGPSQLLPERGDLYEGSIEHFQIDAWSSGPGKVEAKKIGRAIHDVVQDAAWLLDENQRLVILEIEQTNYLVEPDGVTQHAALTFAAHTEPTNGTVVTTGYVVLLESGGKLLLE